MSNRELQGGAEGGTAYFVRFNLGQRVEHIALMVSFSLLVLTGLPQKFDDVVVSQAIISALGGIENVRFVHRVFAAMFVLECLYHLGIIAFALFGGRLQFGMVPMPKDFRDAIHMLQYCIGLRDEKPRFDRFDYRQKFEYWGIVLGAAIMVVTGLVLWFPTLATRVLPGVFVPATKEMHGGEALLAFLVIVIWHLYSVMLSPVHFPGDTTIFSGKISRERTIEEHPLEYERLVSAAAKGPVPAETGPPLG